MDTDPVEIERILSLLAQTPDRISIMSIGYENTRLTFKPDETAWSANDILAHLRSCADVWGKSILAMISNDHPTLRYVSPRTWVRKTNYPTLEFRVSLEGFTRQRNELLQTLQALAIGDWSRGATFTGTVNGREQTVLSYARRMAQHESEHCEQLEKLLETNVNIPKIYTRDQENL
jgi:hypothetical protein